MKKNAKNIIIIGGNKTSQSFLLSLSQCSGINIVSVVDVSDDAPAIQLARELNIKTESDFKQTLKNSDIDFIFNFIDDQKLNAEISSIKPDKTEILGENSAEIFLSAHQKRTSFADDPNPLSYQDIFDLSPIALVVIDINGIVLNLNRKLCEWLKYDSKDALGKNVFMLPFLSKSSKATILENFANRLEGIEVPPYQIEIKTSSGELLSGMVSETLVLDEKNNPEKMLVVISDITSVINKNEQAIESQENAYIAEERFKSIFNNPTFPVILLDTHEKMTAWNTKTEDFLAATKDDLHMQPLSSLYSEGENNNIHKHEGFPQNLETKITKKSGEIIDVNLSLSAIVDSEGNTQGFICFLCDISAGKKVVAELDTAQKMRDDFLSMVSHELKTPITSVQGSIGIVLDGSAGKINEEQKDFLNTAKRNLDRLDCLVNDVVEYQKLELGKIQFELKDVDLNMLIESIKDSTKKTAEKKGLTIDTQLDPSTPHVVCDEEKISKVINSLLDNAIKFTQQGGITIITSVHDSIACVAIKDTGVGIKEADLDKLFRIFGQLTTSARRETGNTGLGLAISKSIVEKHGGKMWVESEHGKGTTFFFLLSLIK